MNLNSGYRYVPGIFDQFPWELVEQGFFRDVVVQGSPAGNYEILLTRTTHDGKTEIWSVPSRLTAFLDARKVLLSRDRVWSTSAWAEFRHRATKPTVVMGPEKFGQFPWDEVAGGDYRMTLEVAPKIETFGFLITLIQVEGGEVTSWVVPDPLCALLEDQETSGNRKGRDDIRRRFRGLMELAEA